MIERCALPVLLVSLIAAPCPVGASAPARSPGAPVPFVEHEAERAATAGTVLRPDRRFGTIAAEASGRSAVRLDRRGQWVSFVLTRAADAVTVRAAIPDGPDGGGMDATLSVVAGGERLGRLALTSRYGWFYGRYPFTNRPADGGAHHVFDDARLRFGRTLPAGTTVRLEVAAGDGAPWYVVDVADFERVAPPAPMPRGALPVTAFGADPSGRRPADEAFVQGIAAARRRGVPLWIPPGTFTVTRHLIVDRVRILGAGPWHSIVRGDGVGFYGRAAPHGSHAVELGGFAIIGEVTDRVDDAQRNAVGGAMGGGSYLHDLFIQHHKVGLWFDGPMRGIRISRLRVTDCTADGLNFHRGVSEAVVADSFWRNTGDDALAAWSHRDADHHIAFRRNTVVAPILANGIAIYGGHDIAVVGNLIADTLTEGGGLHLGNRFDAVPASGRIVFAGNRVVRGGSAATTTKAGVGALWFYALDAPIRADVRVGRTTLVDSNAAAVQFVGKRIGDVAFAALRIDGAAGSALAIGAPGSVSIAGGRVTGTAPATPCPAGFRLWVRATPGLQSCP